MTPQWKNLPVEILDIVFDIIRNRKRTHRGRIDLCQCELTCRAWKLPAQRALLHRIFITRISSLQNLLKLLVSSNLGRSTRHLYFNFVDLKDHGKYFQYDLYMKIFSACFPFLQEISTYKPNYAFYSRIINSQTQWKSLKLIAPPSRAKDLMIYTECVLAYRETLTSLLLCDHIPDAYFHREHKYPLTAEYNILNKRLADFPQLSHLCIYKHSTNNTLIDDLDDTINSCTALNSIQFDIRPPPDKLNNLQQRYDFELARTVLINSHIKELEAQCWMDNNTSLLYIMRKFSGLTSFKFKDSRSAWDDIQLVNPSPCILGQLLSFARKILSHQIEFAVTAESIPNILHSYATSSNQINSEDTILSIKICNIGAPKLVDDSYQPSEKYVDVQLVSKDNTKIDNDGDDGLFITYYGDFAAIQSSRFALFERSGYWFRVLKIEPVKCVTADGKNIFDHIFKYCHQLQTLILNKHQHTPRIKMNADFCSTQSTSLQKIIITSVAMEDNFLQKISNLLPNLKSLNLNCSYQYSQEEERPSTKYRTINLISSTLEEIVYKDDGGFQPREKYIIQLEMEGTKKYYLCTRENPCRAIELVEGSTRSNFIKDEQCGVIIIQCRWVHSITITISPFCFRINN